MSVQNTDDKFTSYLGATMMMSIGSMIMLYVIQQLLPAQPQQEAVSSERYGIWYLGPAGYIMNVENNAEEEPLYVGEALPGTLSSEPGWRIYKYDYVKDPATGDLVSGTVRYADSSTIFDKVWDNRAEYTYC